MRTTITRFVLTLVVMVAGALAPATGASAQEPPTTTAEDEGGAGLLIRLLEVPTDRRDDPRANQYVIDHVAPGTVVQRKVEVTNDSGALLQARIYVGGARIEGDAFAPDDDNPSDLVSWATVTPGDIELAPGESTAAQVEIEVPASASGGERYGAVWAEVAGAEGADGITVVNRVGVRVYLSVGAGVEPPTRFTLPSFQATRDADGRPGVDIEACNVGGRAVDVAGELRLEDGPGGISAGPFPSERGTTIAVDDCATIAVRLDPAIPRGPWRATASIRSGLLAEEAQATIEFPSEPDSASPAVETEARDVTGTSRGRGWLAIAVALLVVVLIVLALLARQRRSAPRQER